MQGLLSLLLEAGLPSSGFVVPSQSSFPGFAKLQISGLIYLEFPASFESVNEILDVLSLPSPLPDSPPALCVFTED